MDHIVSIDRTWPVCVWGRLPVRPTSCEIELRSGRHVGKPRQLYYPCCGAHGQLQEALPISSANKHALQGTIDRSCSFITRPKRLLNFDSTRLEKAVQECNSDAPSTFALDIRYMPSTYQDGFGCIGGGQKTNCDFVSTGEWTAQRDQSSLLMRLTVSDELSLMSSLWI